ncbi:MAG: metal-binding protein [Thermoprotei archaeon]|nr:MAG: metal-binding protein [Thermoprotei archaeon]
MRCIFLSPEDWRKTRNKLLAYCENKGSGCPILRQYYNRGRGNIRFKRIGRVSGLE